MGTPSSTRTPPRRSIHGGYEVAYPQGSHFLLAIIDVFLRGTDDPGIAIAEYNRYVLGVVIGFGCFIAAVVWAARWIAGTRVTEPARVVLAAVVGAIALFGPLGSYLYTCFDAEMIGLLFIAPATAIAVRPLLHDGEHLLAATAATFATFQVYNLLGVLPAATLGASLLVHRFPFREHRRLIALVVVPAGILAVLPTVLSVTSGFDANRQALIVNTHTPIAAAVVIGLAIVATLPLATRRGRQDGVWKGFAVVAAVTAAIVLGFGAYQLASIGTTTYYFGKFVFAAYVIALTGLGNVVRCLPPPGLTLAVDGDGDSDGAGRHHRSLQQRVTTTRPGQLNPEVPIVAWARGERRRGAGSVRHLAGRPRGVGRRGADARRVPARGNAQPGAQLAPRVLQRRPGLDGSRARGDGQARRRADQHLKSAGHKPQNVHTVVVTHSHPDHFGGAGMLRDRYGAEVISHRSFRTWFDVTEEEEAVDDDTEGTDDTAPKAEAGGPFGRQLPWRADATFRPPVKRRLHMLVWRHALKRFVRTPRPTRRVDDAEVVTLAGREWVSLHTPGHTNDHLCLFDPAGGIVLSGDHVLPTITPHISGLVAGDDPLNAFFGSLDKVAALDGVTLSLPAHGLPFTDLAGRAQEIRDHHEERLDTLREAAAELGDGSVEELSHQLFRPRSWGPMAESETYAHLEHLREAGEVTSRDAGGTLRYALVE